MSITLVKTLIKIGRIFFGIAVIAFGVQQLIIKDFRPQILPSFPAWAHQYVIFPYSTGIALILAGIIIIGLFRINENITKRICLGLGIYFFMLLLLCHIPYLLFINPNKITHLGIWAEALKELAFTGGAFVIAGSYENKFNSNKVRSRWDDIFEKIIRIGKIFFSTTMILFGYSHFLYMDYVSAMVPKWFGMPVFWTYLAGTALIGAGLCIIFKIYTKVIAMLLAVMIFLWFIFLHLPDAIANPYLAHGNEIVSAFDALLFSGVVLVIALTAPDVKNTI